MQSVNGAQILNTTSLSPLFSLSLACAAVDIVPLASIYASLNHLNLTIKWKF